MRSLVLLLLLLLSRRKQSGANVLIENLALRHQLAAYRQAGKRPGLRVWDRAFWVGLRRWWPGWRSALVVVEPDTVARWHRAGFRLFWRWKSRPRKGGRPQVEPPERGPVRAIPQVGGLHHRYTQYR